MLPGSFFSSRSNLRLMCAKHCWLMPLHGLSYDVCPSCTVTPRFAPSSTICGTIPPRVLQNRKSATNLAKNPQPYWWRAPLHGHTVSSACRTSDSLSQRHSLYTHGLSIAARAFISSRTVLLLNPMRRATVPTVMWWR